MIVCFVKKRKEKKKQSKNSLDADYPNSAYTLVLAKRMNMRIPEELLEVTLQEFYDMVDIYFDNGEDKGKNSVRQATQADIDRFMG